MQHKTNCRILAYCLMPTHYHYLMQLTDSNLFSKKMSHFFNCYCKSLNSYRNETGRFFPTRFQAKLVDDEKYLIGLCGYIHLNPVRSTLVKTVDEWPYSNYLACIGKGKDRINDRELFKEMILDYSDYEEFIKTRFDDEGLESYVFS